MAFPQDEQAEAVTNATADAAAVTAGEVGTPVGSDVASSPSFTTATPKRLSTTHETDLYINITTAASLTISMGPEAAGTSVALNAAESDALGLIYIRVPVGWYVKITGTIADLGIKAVSHESVA